MRKYRMEITIEVKFSEDDIEALFDTKLEPKIKKKLRLAAEEGDDSAMNDVRTSINLYKLPDYYVGSEIEKLECWDD